jgi:predicted permease
MRSLRAWLRRRRLNRDLEKELRFHVEAHTDDLIAGGVPVDEARRRARVAFGGLDQIAELVRDGRADLWIDHLSRDLRDALRSIARTPGLAATVMILIAVVIGGNTTVFSVIHGILTKPAPGVRAGGLVTLDLTLNGRPYNGGNSYPNYLDYVAGSMTIRPLVVDSYERFTVGTSGGSYALRGDLVSTNYFDTFGLSPVMGRTFIDDDDRMGAAGGLATVVSHRLWQQRFAGAADIVGQTIALNGHPATIIGVAPPGFAGAVLGASSDIWVPLVPYARVHETEHELHDRSTRRLGIFGRLVPHTPLSEAQAEFATLSRRLQTAYPQTNRDFVARPIPYAAIATGSLFSRRGYYLLALFSVITLLTVLIVCANVANLLLARAALRQRELALRQALGASRGRLFRVLLVESLVVSLIAWLFACAFAITVSRVLANLIPPDPSGTSFNPDFSPDWTVGTYALALALFGTVAFTLLPALRLWRQDVLPWLKAGERGVVRGQSRLSRALVVTQLAFSVLLLTAAGLAYRSLTAMSRLELGFNPSHVLLASVNTAGSARTPEANRQLIEDLRAGIGAIPGVESVSHVRWSVGWGGEPIRLRVTDEPIRVTQNFVGPAYLEVLGLVPIVGREFPARDARRGNAGAIINQRLADALWPGQSAIGHTILVGQEPQTLEIVGVAPNAIFNGTRGDEHPNFVFRSEAQEPGTPGEVTFYVRYAGSLDAAASALGRALREVDASVPVVSVRTMEAELNREAWVVHAMSGLLTAFAIGSLAIAVIGQYAIVAFGVRRRIRDFGLRMALGASSHRILRSVLGEAFHMTLVGLLGGFALSLAAGTALRGLLYGVTPTDARTYVAVFVLLTMASLVACYLPARHATRIDPMRALRQE